MDTKTLKNKVPMSAPGFTILTPKQETEYDKKIQEEQQKRMTDCCDGDGYSHYDRYGYKPRPPKTLQDTSTPVPSTESQNVPAETHQNNGKR